MSKVTDLEPTYKTIEKSVENHKAEKKAKLEILRRIKQKNRAILAAKKLATAAPINSPVPETA